MKQYKCLKDIEHVVATAYCESCIADMERQGLTVPINNRKEVEIDVVSPVRVNIERFEYFSKKREQNAYGVEITFCDCDEYHSYMINNMEEFKMARVKINCKCELCGGTFEHIKFKNNRTEAEKYEEWAKENITVCPDCYRRNEEEEAKKTASEKAELPELTGTEKQVAYAEKLRAKIVSKANMADIKACMLVINKDEAFMAEAKKKAEAANITTEEMIEKAVKSYGLSQLLACLQETNAGKLLDVIA